MLHENAKEMSACSPLMDKGNEHRLTTMYGLHVDQRNEELEKAVVALGLIFAGSLVGLIAWLVGAV